MRPVVIGVGGAHSGSGKTEFASLILQHFRGWGAIKYTRSALYSSVTDDPGIISMKGKDTQRLLDSGACKVLWVKSPAYALRDVLPVSVDMLSDLEGIVVEGNSAIEFIRPDVILFIFGSDIARTKESARRVLRMAHMVVSGEGQFPDLPKEVKRFDRSTEGKERLVRCIKEMVEIKEKIRSLLKERSTERKIPCTLARRIAEELHVSYREIGDAANELDIKITSCELGCF
jgi:molybdopterin-guanine dinucleotide biosynthesis protein